MLSMMKTVSLRSYGDSEPSERWDSPHIQGFAKASEASTGAKWGVFDCGDFCGYSQFTLVSLSSGSGARPMCKKPTPTAAK